MFDKALTQIAMDYGRSRALCAAARLGIADALGDENKTVEELADECGANPDALYRLMRALASFGVVAEIAHGRFVLSEFGQPLRKDAPNSEWAAVVFWADLLADNWRYLTECVRTGETANSIMAREGVTSRYAQEPRAQEIFRAVMGSAPAPDYMPIAKAWDFGAYDVVADLGGGGGALIDAVLTQYTGVKGMLVDRPEAIEAARPRFESGALSSRCTLIGADLSVAVPAGADVYMLKHVLHGFPDDGAINILRNCSDVLGPNGRVLVIEFVLPDVVNRADPALEVRLMSDLNMMTVTGGRERSGVEWKALLEEAGLECRGITAVKGDLASVVEGAKV